VPAGCERLVQPAHDGEEPGGAFVGYAVGRRTDLVPPDGPQRAQRHVTAGDVAIGERLEACVAELDDDAVDGRGEPGVAQEREDEVVLLAQLVRLPESHDAVARTVVVSELSVMWVLGHVFSLARPGGR
jgi:hypothetical protein